ncbi:two-component system response regulator, partial [Nostoc sp. FACHB-110]|uniref:response regulator n=1 Tax=Nostoc sp. FACHB-110 TaxID=2692834 RepID=UPI00168582DA
MKHSSYLTILLIDDCAEERETYCRFLRQDSLYTYRILEFNTSIQAMAWCQYQIPDVILLDSDGLTFIHQFREIHPHSQTAVIMLTKPEDEITSVQVMKSGVQDYLVKDKLTPAILQSAIHHAIERMYLTRQLEKSQEKQQLVAQIALRIRQSLKLEEILHQTAQQVRQFLQADRVLV